MSDDKDGTGLVSGGTTILRAYGLGGLLLVIGFVLMGLAIYKGPDFTETSTQNGVLVGGLVVGGFAVIVGLVLLRRAPPPTPAPTPTTRPRPTPRHDVYIAAPMAGFGTDEAGRNAAVELVNAVQAALRRLGIEDVYTPVLARPDAPSYESPGTGFDVEWEALQSARRYLLILPPTMPAGTSVLMTAGAAIALGIPCVILSHESRSALPYMLEGAVQSRQVNVRLHPYRDIDSIELLIRNDGLRLFGQEPA
ncbi:MAG TPA: hypothetical protein VKI44_01335 [Acetobacteraceae bacterium]|nr:hypothetical protein [Acetobacteraceae bacterium]